MFQIFDHQKVGHGYGTVLSLSLFLSLSMESESASANLLIVCIFSHGHEHMCAQECTSLSPFYLLPSFSLSAHLSFSSSLVYTVYFKVPQQVAIK